MGGNLVTPLPASHLPNADIRAAVGDDPAVVWAETDLSTARGGKIADHLAGGRIVDTDMLPQFDGNGRPLASRAEGDVNQSGAS